jgi:radical SAM superfamily enzyme YgiQ (UPF0313 family)
MPPKVSLICPANNVDIIYLLPPLGGLYLTSFLKEKGINANFSDFNILKNWKKKLYEIVETKPDIIGLTSHVSNYLNTHYLANIIKSIDRDIKVLVGGPYPTCVPKKYLYNRNIDAVCIGEGEYTLYKYLTSGDKTAGLMIRKNGAYFLNEPSQNIENLDSLPFPDLTQVNIKKYCIGFQKRKPVSNIITSRGCPYNCSFCFHGVHGYKWRARSPKNVVKEIEWQVSEFGVREICFWDDNLTMDMRRAEKIFELISKKQLDFVSSTPNGVRADKLSRNLLNKMKKGGLWSVTLAPETGDPFILNKIQKGFSLEQIEKVASWCKELDIFLITYFMMGFPFEKLNHVYNTIKFIKKISPNTISIHKFYPFPKTPISEEFNLKDYSGHDYRTAKIPKSFKKLYIYTYLLFYLNPSNWKKIIDFVGMKNFIQFYILKYIKGNIRNFLNKIFKNLDYIR